MSILWCGGEDIDFQMTAGAIGEDSIYSETGYSRASIMVNTTAISPVFPGGAITNAWVSWRHRANLGIKSGKSFGVIDFATRKGLYVGTASTHTNRYAFWTWNGTAWTEITAEAGTSLVTDQFVPYDMQIIDYGDSATINLYVSKNLVLTYTGDVTPSGVTNFDCVTIRSLYYNMWNTDYFTEVIVADEDTRNMRLVTSYPNAAGDTLDWTGAYTTVDEGELSDADLAYDNTVGHQAMYGLSDTPAGSWSVKAVKIAVRATRSSDSTPTHLGIGIKSGGSVNTASVALATAWSLHERFMATNPITSAAFTTGEVDAMQVVLESVT